MSACSASERSILLSSVFSCSSDSLLTTAGVTAPRVRFNALDCVPFPVAVVVAFAVGDTTPLGLAPSAVASGVGGCPAMPVLAPVVDSSVPVGSTLGAPCWAICFLRSSSFATLDLIAWGNETPKLFASAVISSLFRFPPASTLSIYACTASIFFCCS